MKVKGVIQWVPASEAVEAEFRLYDHLFLEPEQVTEDNLMEKDGLLLNRYSLEKTTGYVERYALEGGYDRFQFIRNGYFYLDKSAKGDRAVFNRTVSLKSSFKI